MDNSLFLGLCCGAFNLASVFVQKVAGRVAACAFGNKVRSLHHYRSQRSIDLHKASGTSMPYGRRVSTMYMCLNASMQCVAACGSCEPGKRREANASPKTPSQSCIQSRG